MRELFAFFTAFALSLLLGSRFIRKLYELKIGQPIREEECPALGVLHHDKKDTPTMGGILMVFTTLVSSLIWGDLSSGYLKLLIIVMLAFAFVGGRDDYLKLKYKNSKGMSKKMKMIFQGAIALFLSLYLLVPEAASWLGNAPLLKEGVESLSLQEYMGRIYLPFVNHPILSFSGLGLIAIFFWIFFVVSGASNAVNFTDGLDGLAAGLIILSSAAFAVIAYIVGHEHLANYFNLVYIDQASEIAVFLAAVAGASLGFLWYNCSIAQVFMGDIGSLTMGGILGTAAILLGKGFLLGLIGLVFVIEALSVIIQIISYRGFNQSRVFLCAPIHHHFEYKGFKETKIVVRAWIIGLIAALAGLLSVCHTHN